MYFSVLLLSPISAEPLVPAGIILYAPFELPLPKGVSSKFSTQFPSFLLVDDLSPVAQQHKGNWGYKQEPP